MENIRILILNSLERFAIKDNKKKTIKLLFLF